MKKLGKYIITDQSNEYPHNWFNLFPFIAIQHKYWYLWTINFGWFYFDRTYEICNEDWNENSKMYCQVTGLYFNPNANGALAENFEIILSKKEYKAVKLDQEEERLIKKKIAEDYNIVIDNICLITDTINYNILQ